MTTYKKITAKFEAVAEAVNPSGLNLHGSYLDLGTKEDLIFPIVQLLMPFTITELRDRSGANAELLFFFGRPDSFDSNETERAAYIDEMMTLADDFVNEWDNGSPLVSRSSQVRMEPLFKLGRDTLTGVGVLFTVQVAGC
jgi:hypothetical protein